MSVIEPMVDWLGDIPITHGERDVAFDSPEFGYCLCGNPNYLMCLIDNQGVFGITLGEPFGGLL